mgnify:FL=1
MVKRNTKTRGLVPSKTIQVLSEEERKILLAQAVGNPLDFRTDEEMAAAFGYSDSQYQVIRRSKAFNHLVEETFRESLPGVKVDIFKRLARLATQNSSIPASRLVLQWLGEIDSPGTVKVLGGGTGGSSDNTISQLSPEELDKTIVRLLRDTNPEDVSLEGWKVTPVGNVRIYQAEADFEVLGDDDGGPPSADTSGRTEFSGQEA